MKKQFLKTVYINRSKSKDSFDKVILVSKDDENGKSWQLIEKPAITFHITKPEEWDGKFVNAIKEERTYPVTAYNKSITKTIVNELNDPSLNAAWQFATKSRTREAWDSIKEATQMDGRVHGSDINIEDFYIQTFNTKYNPDDNFIDNEKSFMDIEVDGTNIEGFPNPEEAMAPVNAISFFVEKTQNMYMYVLKYNTETYADFKNRFSDLEAEVNEYYRKDFPNFTLKFKEFDQESDLILTFLDDLNNKEKPDFCGAWNLDFDFPTLYNRLARLGFDPNEAFSSNDFPYKNAYYRLEPNPKKPVADRSSNFITSSYTSWIDMLATYANITKPMGVLESYSLDFVTNKELGEHKIDLGTTDEGEDEEDGTDITNIFLRDYYRFIRYSIHDTMLLALLEKKMCHLDLLKSIATMTSTRINKALKKTICLRNMTEYYYRKEHGMILSNNRSRLYPHTGEKKEGAFVGDPNLIDNIGIDMGNGNLSQFIFKHVTDLDLSSLYPNIQIAFNIAPETFTGALRYMVKDPVTGVVEDKTNDFIDAYNSRDAVKFGIEYYGLPNYQEMEALVNGMLD